MTDAAAGSQSRPEGQEEWATQARIAHCLRLRGARDRPRAKLLAEVVDGNLTDVWSNGGRRTPHDDSPSPAMITLRSGFFVQPPKADLQPALTRLVRSRGVLLRLELLLLFEAQCRHLPGEEVRNDRRIVARADDPYAGWRDLVLVYTGTRDAATLRRRQITEALSALERENLVELPRRGPHQRVKFDGFRLLSEASTPEEGPAYAVPDAGVALPREFFTNLWVFALTDAELATYLVLRWLRTRFPTSHVTNGIYLASKVRPVFGLSRKAWRSCDLLHRFGLLERQQQDDGRDWRTGQVAQFQERYAKRAVPPVRWKLPDDALRRPALDVVHQVLTRPTDEDRRRRFGVVEGDDGKGFPDFAALLGGMG